MSFIHLFCIVYFSVCYRKRNNKKSDLFGIFEIDLLCPVMLLFSWLVMSCLGLSSGGLDPVVQCLLCCNLVRVCCDVLCVVM